MEDGKILNLARKRIQAVPQSVSPCARETHEDPKHLSAKEALRLARSRNIKARLAYVANAFRKLEADTCEINVIAVRSMTRQRALLAKLLDDDIKLIDDEYKLNKK